MIYDEPLEKTPLSARNLPETYYEAIRQGAAIDPNAPATSFSSLPKAISRRRF